MFEALVAFHGFSPSILSVCNETGSRLDVAAFTLTCYVCADKLDSRCQLFRGKALCSRCYLTSSKIAVCCACHHAIEGRVVLALGRVWHPEHLVCRKCEEILSGGSFYEENGEPLCFYHFRILTQEICHSCRNLLPECLIEFANKLYCLEHFTCELCDKLLRPGGRFHMVDLRPVCKSCYRRLPIDMQRHLQKWGRKDKHPVNIGLRNFIDRLLCIYPRSSYARKQIPLNREALPYLRSGQFVAEPSAVSEAQPSSSRPGRSISL
uniref:LIM zinc-binding domain-containing protein n=1 Tax=Mesocestoides corti TaxID=53468 RepID=A0A5K3FYV0_MESCO